ncbi:MAG: MotA/TolQ/ExbB proton channel family protein [Bdellovibrionota bacterium]
MAEFFDFMRTSFLHVSPILLAGVIALAIIIERARALCIVYPLKNAPEFFDRLSEFVTAGRSAEALTLCDRYHQKPSARVIKQGLLRAHQPEELIEHGLHIAVSEASQMVQRRTSFLATIANVATLLGLLGTIAGLIHSFQAVGHADPQQKSALLAAGISQAMNATMLGLGVAIPCMIAFSFLINRTNRLISEIDQSAVRTMDMLQQRYYLAETETLRKQSRPAERGAA